MLNVGNHPDRFQFGYLRWKTVSVLNRREKNEALLLYMKFLSLNRVIS